MVQVQMTYKYSKDGQIYRLILDSVEMPDAIEMSQKIQEVLYDQGYHVTDIKMQEAAHDSIS